jgi:hypothetical protein
MTTSAPDNSSLGKRVSFVRSAGRTWLMVELNDGRAVGVPLSLYPTLLRATPLQRGKYRRIGRGHGFHWDALDVDLSVEGIIAGRGEAKTRSSRRSA